MAVYLIEYDKAKKRNHTLMKRLPLCLLFAIGTTLSLSQRKSSLLKGVKKTSSYAAPKSTNTQNSPSTESLAPQTESSALNTKEVSAAEQSLEQKPLADATTTLAPAEQKTAAPRSKERTINLKTNISAENLGYNYLGTTYYPTFEIEANKAPCEPRQEKPITLKNNKLSLSYLCEFKKWGISYHREHKTLDYTVPESMNTVNVEFSWNNKDEHITVPGAQLIASKSIK